MREGGEVDQGFDVEVGHEGGGFERGGGDGAAEEEHSRRGGVRGDEQVAEVGLKEIGGRLLDEHSSYLAADEAGGFGELERTVGQAFGEASAMRAEGGVGDEGDLAGVSEDLGDDADDALAVEERAAVGGVGRVARRAGGDPGVGTEAVECAGGDSKGMASRVGVVSEDASDDDSGGVEELAAQAGEVVDGGGELVETRGLVSELTVELLDAGVGGFELLRGGGGGGGAASGVASVVGEVGGCAADPFEGLDDDAQAAGPVRGEEDGESGEREEEGEGTTERESVWAMDQGKPVRY